jgi:perosamine synthetase
MDCMKSGWVSSLGTFIDTFELEFAKFCGTKYAVSTSNGTVALHLALVALGIGPGDEVIIPDLTFVATANAVLYTGAKVVIADIDPISLCISASDVRKKITSNTKCIIPVHLYGHPADMVELLKITKEYNISLIEDAAEAHGAKISNKRVGGYSDMACFSFYGNKIITTGEGGMITTNNQQLYNKLRFLRDHAMSKEKRYWHDEVGFNYRITNMQAALGCSQLLKIDNIINRKREIFYQYYNNLKNLDGMYMQPEINGYTSVYWLVNIILTDENYIQNRDVIQEKLKNFGIDSRMFFYPLSSFSYIKYDYKNTPISNEISRRGMSLPSYPNISNEEIDFVCNTIQNILKDL